MLGSARRHPLRVLLPVLGVGVGVAAVAAIHHANRSVTESFRNAADAVSGHSDFAVTGVAGVPVDALRRLAFLWEAGSFAPSLAGYGVLDDGSGEVVQILGIDWGGAQAAGRVRLMDSENATVRARLLAEPSVLVPDPLARRRGLSTGKTLRLVVGGRRSNLLIAGRIELSGLGRAAGGDVLVTDLFTAQKLLGRPGVVDRVDVFLDPGISVGSVRSRVAVALTPGLSVEPPGRTARTADQMVRAFRFNLNALGALTLVVALFLVANAVSVSVVRRRPEIAVLRALGASRASIFASFLAEGLAIGAAGTLLGEIGGLLLSRAALASVGGTISSVYLPAAKIEAAGRLGPALLAAGAGLAAALVATLVPAWEATHVQPAPAMRPGSVEVVRRRRLLPRGIAAAAALAGAAVSARAEPVAGFPLFGFLAVALVVVALALASPLLVRGLAELGGKPLTRLFGVPGRLASGFFGGALARNGVAVTALATALGMTLAMIVTVASIRRTVQIWVETSLAADLWVKSASGRSRGIIGDLPPDAIPFVQGVPGVAAVDPFRAREAFDARGRAFTVGSGDFGVVARMGGLSLLDGGQTSRAASEARERGEVLISEPYARRFGVGIGDLVEIRTPRGPRRFRVRAVYRDFSNDRGTVVMDRALYLALFDDPRVTSLGVLAAPGQDPGALRRRILTRSPFALTITTTSELRREVLAIFDKTFAVTRALEGIAVAVAVMGIANALIASAVERRRSFGLLRAVGVSREQIRGTVLLEGVLTGTAGTLAAVAAGGAFAALLLAVINPQSFGWTVAPALPLKALAAAVGLVLAASAAAGLFPGRLAAAVDPAQALAEE